MAFSSPSVLQSLYKNKNKMLAKHKRYMVEVPDETLFNPDSVKEELLDVEVMLSFFSFSCCTWMTNYSITLCWKGYVLQQFSFLCLDTVIFWKCLVLILLPLRVKFILLNVCFQMSKTFILELSHHMLLNIYTCMN